MNFKFTITKTITSVIIGIILGILLSTKSFICTEAGPCLESSLIQSHIKFSIIVFVIVYVIWSLIQKK